MATHSEIQDQAYQFFIEEAPELLQLIETGLLNLQQERSTAKIHDLMRAAHSIKGGAASMKSFNFQEECIGDHDSYLWGHTAIAMATRVADSFAKYRWCPNIIGPAA
ncbi:MAG: hypothetical protein F6K44_31460, partial [Moorea sp. SIO3E2]|nr:hypothetical protein [Moorena sp. SIO3E2]